MKQNAIRIVCIVMAILMLFGVVAALIGILS